jgi:hypothetical protein
LNHPHFQPFKKTMPSNPPPATPNPRPPFTSLSRILCTIAISVTIVAMYCVIKSDAMDGRKKLLAVGGVLLAGILVISAGAHFSDGRHRK